MRLVNHHAAVFAAIVALAASAAEADVAIEHPAVECVVAGRFPRLEARVPSGAGVARARIHFRPESSSHWYSVDMTPAGDALVGRLPRPKKSLASFHYYIEVTDAAFASNRTAEYAPRVAASAGECSGNVQAATEAAATVLLLASPGAPAVPLGFSSTGVTTVAAGSTGAAAASTGTVAAGGGGIGSTALIVGGVALAAAAGAGLAVTGDSGREDRTYNVTFGAPGIDVSACAGRALSWSSQVVSAAADGTFDDTWAPGEPNTARVVGRVTATTFDATITCVSGGPSGTLSATGTGETYNGSFSFRGSNGPLTVTPSR